VISDDTAVLGLGNIGPLAGKPVMEGKGILFKRFADIDVFGMDNPAWRKPTWTVTLQTSSSITV
jgi:malate dehydrogenase (oxaloacetate-decarboxylating)(NADP+)